MSISSPAIASRTGSASDAAARRLERLVARARRALAIERFLPALWPALAFPALYVALALAGAFAFVPWPVQALLLAAAVTATGVALEVGLAAFSWPDWRDAARRLERDNNLMHRPISESRDMVVGDDPFAHELWRLHQARRLPVARLKVALPRIGLAHRDPYGLRYLVLLLVAGGVVLAGPGWRARLWRGVDSGAGLATGLDAWIDPPGYTGLPPVYLAAGDRGTIAVPAGSMLNLRAHDADHAPGLSLGGGFDLESPPRFSGHDGEYAATQRITADADVRVRASGHTIGAWQIKAIPDKVPVISFDGLPSATEHQATKISFRASDDYGVTSAKLVLTPHGRHGAPLSVDLPVTAAKAIRQTSYVDLTGHPYAGLMVDAKLQARDATGQMGISRTVTFRLPARIFTDPLARALIEQRQNLATSDAAGLKRVIAALDALSIAPDRFYGDMPAIYMGLRAAYWALREPRPDIAHAENLLWQMAMALEQHGLLDAAAELRRLQALLTAAMASGAPQDVIDQLLNRYNQAMQRYLQALANNPGAAPPPMQDGNAKTITQNDIQSLVKAIQQLSAAGDRQQAARMLALLQSILENLHMAQGGQGGGDSAKQNALNGAMQKFGEMMSKERSLLDKTMRQQNGNGDPKDGGAQGLARQQQQLRQELDKTMKSLDMNLGSKLGPAGQAMDRAGQSLGQGNLGNAGNEEQNALDALRKGAEALAKEAQQEGGQGQAGGDTDPLGRSHGVGPGSTKLPGASELARARAILEELRRRAGERGRPQEELDYIDRLLKEF